MNRIPSPRLLRSLKRVSVSKYTLLTPGSRVLSTGLRPLTIHASSRVSQYRAAFPSFTVKTYSSLANAAEDDVFTFDESSSSSSSEPGVVDERVVSLNISRQESSVASFGKFWLRENCQCPKCIHPDTRQRASNTFSIPPDVNIQAIKYQKRNIHVQWSDGHSGWYPYRWLALHSNKKVNRKNRGAPLRFRDYKSYQSDQQEYPTVAYSEVMAGDAGLLEWLENIYDWGFCFVSGVPISPESTETLLKRIAFIRHTHYGGFWDFTADLTFKDTAYTNEFLGAHTDNTYFTDPARLQLFHLLSHTDGSGGASLLVDGFRAAATLQEENPEHARYLLSTKHPFHASGNDDICIQPSEQFPILKTHQYLRELYQIRWNNYDRAPKRDWWVDEQDMWYAAARHFDEIIRRPSMEIWTQLKPGTALIFDNWRMMHGRSEFTGKRRMCGGYINNDDFISRYRVLKFGRKELLQHLGNTARHPTNPNRYV